MLVIVLLTVVLPLVEMFVSVVIMVLMLFPLFVIVVLGPPFWDCRGDVGFVATFGELSIANDLVMFGELSIANDLVMFGELS